MTPKRHSVRRRLIAAATLVAIIQATWATALTTTVDARYEPVEIAAVNRAPDAAVAAPPVIQIDDGRPGPMTLGRVWVLRREMAIASADPVPDPKPTSTPSPSARSTSSRPAASRPSPVALQLRIPDLGITQTTRSYPCDRVQPPANYVYRWGCAGTNNLYLLGHAYSVFKPLHDAYAKGRIRVGMAAYWTNSKGRRITYRVTAWRLVRPDDPGWAIASQPVPSMTLQTCYGADNEYRLVVRLVAG